MGGAHSRAATVSDLRHFQTQTSFPDILSGKYAVPYARTIDSAIERGAAGTVQLTVALIGRHVNSDVESAAKKLRSELAGSGIKVTSLRVADVADLPLGHSQAEADRALLERVVASTATPHVILADCNAEISAGALTAYAANIAGNTPNIAVLNLTGIDGNPHSTEDDAVNVDFDFDFDFDAEPGTATTGPAHGLVLNELLRPGFAIAMETSRLRDALPATPSMPFAWLVSWLLRDAHLNGLHLHRYGAIVPGQADTWSPAATTPIHIHEKATGQHLEGVTVSVAAAGANLSSLTATIDSLLRSEDVALNIYVLGTGPDESLTIADAYAATGIVRVGQDPMGSPATLVQMGVEAGIIFECQSLRKILAAAAELDYSVLRLVTGPADSKIEVWPTALLSTALTHADDSNIDEFVLRHGREHWNSGSKFGLTIDSPATASTTR